MKPVTLETARLRLDAPVLADGPRVVEYCQDPLFEKYLTLPWPYGERDAEHFLGILVPMGWAKDNEYTWALRTEEGGPLLGVIGYRAAARDIGYWIGEPYRGNGYMTEALREVARWLFATGVMAVGWECVVGNLASASVARKTGFRFTGERPSAMRYRDGNHPQSWSGSLRAEDGGAVQTGWPKLGN